MAIKSYGIDVSHWEGEIDWKAVEPHVYFAGMKAYQIYVGVDGSYLANKAGCLDNDIPWFAYCYFRPGYDPETQAVEFVEAVGDKCKVYVCDLETTIYAALARRELSGVANTGVYNSIFEIEATGVYSPNVIKIAMRKYRGRADPSPALALATSGPLSLSSILSQTTDVAKVFLDKVEELTGRKPMIYTSPGFWNTYCSPPPSWTPDYDLWVAHWGVQEPTLPNGWTSYVLHQIGDEGSVPGIDSFVDENYFLGDEDDAREYFGGESMFPKMVRANLEDYMMGMPILSYPDNNKVYTLYFVKDKTRFEAIGEVGDFYEVKAGYIPVWMCEDV
jgi:GH25 family lysozyme M1 (1,4-beta-N-acetylmuramidase)